MAMGTGDYFGVFNDSFARFHFQVKPLAVVLTFEFPRSSRFTADLFTLGRAIARRVYLLKTAGRTNSLPAATHCYPTIEGRLALQRLKSGENRLLTRT